MKKKLDYIIIVIVGLLIISYIFLSGNMYGSTTDWLNQHTVFPEYFRMLFYQTGEIFPNFAPHIGAGQNIFNFSYYGLLNPVYMFSYLLPFIKMVDYLQVVSIISVLVSACLFYKWMDKNKFARNICLTTSLLFLTAGPLIFHSHRHLMFVNYMPFLMIALIGVIDHFEEKRNTLLITGIFLMILSSYFYSVGGILAVSIYGVYYYLKKYDKVTLKNFSKESLSFIWPILTGVMASALLLLPTLLTILLGRTTYHQTVNIFDLLIPKINMNGLLYSSYSIGLTSIVILSLLYGLFDRKKENRFLIGSCVTLVIIPLFMYLLNGALYIRAKVLIPFLPLYVLVIGLFIQSFIKREIPYKYYGISLIVFNLVLLLIGYRKTIYYVDLIITVIILLSYLKHHKKWLMNVSLVLISITFCITENKTDTYITNERYEKIFSHDQELLIKETLKNDQSFYRFNNLFNALYTSNKIYDINYYQTSLYSSTYNKEYKELFASTFENANPSRNILSHHQVEHPLFQPFMGVKYIVGSHAPIGYELVKQSGPYNLYKNDYAFPLGWVSNQTLNDDIYNKLSNVEQMEALMNYVITDNGNTEFVSDIEYIDLDFEEDHNDNIIVEKKENGYYIDVKKDSKLTLKLNEAIYDNILFIQFKMNKAETCKVGDTSITINGIKNKLTCKEWMYYNNNELFSYAISDNDEIKELIIGFTKGTYEIADIKVALLPYQISSLSFDRWNVTPKDIKGDQITGKIEVQLDGYFITTIPYDQGFNVFVDGQKIDYEKVNEGFIGFPLKEGNHDIMMIYEAPGFKMGKLISFIGISIFLGVIFIEYPKEYKGDRKYEI